jgi:hypothetical protein
VRCEDLLLLLKAPCPEPAKLSTAPPAYLLALVDGVACESGGRSLSVRLAPGALAGRGGTTLQELLATGSSWHALPVAGLTTHMRWDAQPACACCGGSPPDSTPAPLTEPRRAAPAPGPGPAGSSRR